MKDLPHPEVLRQDELVQLLLEQRPLREQGTQSDLQGRGLSVAVGVQEFLLRLRDLFVDGIQTFLDRLRHGSEVIENTVQTELEISVRVRARRRLGSGRVRRRRFDDQDPRPGGVSTVTGANGVPASRTCCAAIPLTLADVTICTSLIMFAGTC